MPWLPCYVSGDDTSILLSFLNQSDDVAFIVADGDGRWKAVTSIPKMDFSRLALWNIPSGPLPLLRGHNESIGQIDNPWAGWNEERTGSDPTVPYFGAGHPGIIWFNLKPTQQDISTGVLVIGLSSFEWIGNHYRVIGSSASPFTEKLWKSLRKFLREKGTKVPRGGPSQGTPDEIWALPHALNSFANGAMGSFNP